MTAPTIDSRPADFSARRSRALDPATRHRIESIVERLIAFLDALDGDADLEPDLGVAERHPSGRDMGPTPETSQTRWAEGGRHDVEAAHV